MLRPLKIDKRAIAPSNHYLSIGVQWRDIGPDRLGAHWRLFLRWAERTR
jgi:hypothetical protein